MSKVKSSQHNGKGFVNCGKCGKPGHNKRTCSKTKTITAEHKRTRITQKENITSNDIEKIFDKLSHTLQEEHEQGETETEDLETQNTEEVQSNETYGGEFSLSDLEVLWGLYGGEDLKTFEGEERLYKDKYKHRREFTQLFNKFSETYFEATSREVITLFLEQASDYEEDNDLTFEISNPDKVLSPSQAPLEGSVVGNYIRWDRHYKYFTASLASEKDGTAVMHTRPGIPYYIKSDKLFTRHQVSFALNPATPEDKIVELANSKDVTVRSAAMQNISIPADVLDAMYDNDVLRSKKPSLLVMSGVLKNGIVPSSEKITKIYEDMKRFKSEGKMTEEQFDKLEEYVAENIKTSEELVAQLSKSNHEKTLRTVASRVRGNKAIAERLSKHPNGKVRKSLAQNTQLPRETIEPLLEKLSEDEEVDVAKAAQSRLFVFNSFTPEDLVKSP